MNYNGKLKDVFTIAMRWGTPCIPTIPGRRNLVYGGHSIFTAEVASTVNENLLMKHLLEKENDKRKKLYLFNMYIEEFRATLFRQTMFAEFEKLTHEAVESGEVLTADWLSKNYLELNKKYFGDQVVYDEQIAMEWARILISTMRSTYTNMPQVILQRQLSEKILNEERRPGSLH